MRSYGGGVESANPPPPPAAPHPTAQEEEKIGLDQVTVAYYSFGTMRAYCARSPESRKHLRKPRECRNKTINIFFNKKQMYKYTNMNIKTHSTRA